MADLPTALITEILSRLPVKSLLRFRPVSKSWQSLINDPHFIKLHLKRSQQNTTNQTLVLRDCYLYSANFPTLDRAAVIDHPLKSDRIGTALLGSCNGLLCLSNGEQEGEGTILYNPATRKHRELPFSSIEFPDSDFLILCERIVYGFGYDHVHDDYKVVRIIQFFEQNPDLYDSEVKVYSLKTGSWRRIADFPREYYLSYKRASGVYVNGYLHWVVARKPESDGTQLIVAFDLGSEECRVVPQPKYSTGEFHLNVGVLQGWLCVMSNYPYFRTDVWVMKEYGVKESWVKLFTVSQRKVGPFDYVRPLAMKGSEVLLEQDCANLLWFHLHTQRARSVNMRDMPRSLDAEMMVESLVPLDSHKKKRKRKPKKNRHEQSEQVSCHSVMLSRTLLFNILSCLPAKMLLQLRCVCKAWNNVIQDPDFAKLHLQVSLEDIDNRSLIISGEKMHLVDFSPLNKAVQVNHPLKFGQGFTNVLAGSCNGLVCLANQDKEIALWNPMTGHYHMMPTTKSPKESNVLRSFIYGFGYDLASDDYKIVRILQLYSYSSYDFSDEGNSDSEIDHFAGSEVHVLSLKAKYWRRIKCFPYVLCYLCSGVLSNGALHWVARQRHNLDGTSYIIMAFDLGLENCRVVPQPNYEDIHFSMTLEVFGGSLCVLCHYPKCGVEIWVMKDYEMGYWQKLISIAQRKPIGIFEYIKPLAYSRNSCELLLLLDYQKLIWYDLLKKTIRHVTDVSISDLRSSFDTDFFSGSLLDPNNISGNEVNLGRLNLAHSLHCNEKRHDSMLRHEQQSGQFKHSLGSLPKKLLCHIFSTLSVKVLLRVQRVCKMWYNLINDPEFIKHHLEASSRCKRGLSLILTGEKFFSVDLPLLDKAVEIGHPLMCSEGFTNFVGSSDGLVCLNKSKDFALWNQWTGKYEKLCPVNLQLPNASYAFHCIIHGFGYDHTSSDYKVVCVLQQHSRLKGGRVQSEVQVYSLKAKSWRGIKCFPFMVCSPCSGILANGALHWVARQNPDLFSNSSLVIAFDLGTEKYRVLTQPSYVDTDFEMSLGVLGGGLCVLCQYPKQGVDIWVMTDYGRQSWERLASILQTNIGKHFEYMKPLAYSEDGTEVLLEQDNERLLWYNLRKKTVRYVEIHGLPLVFEAVVCLASLVQIGKATKNYDTMHEQPSKLCTSQRVKKERDDLDGFLTKGFRLKL